MQTYIRQGYGVTVGQCDFYRVGTDTPITLAPAEYAERGHVIGYIAGDPKHLLGFMRPARVRVHVRRDCVAERDS